MEKYYTIAEIGKILRIPESTVRYYRDRYSHYLPYKGQGRKKRYTEKALEVLRIIAEESNHNTTAEAIEELLSSKFPTFVEVEIGTATPTVAAQQQGNFPSLELLLNMSESLKIIADKMVLFEQQQQVIAEQNRRIALLEGEIQTLKDTQQTAKQQQLEAPKGFFARVFKK